MCVCSVGPTHCWHDLDNSEYDCWPLDKPNEYNMIDCGGENLTVSMTECLYRYSTNRYCHIFFFFLYLRPGLEMAWVVRPPETVKTGEVFSVTYSVTARDSFYHWAIDNHIFTNRLVHL